MTISEIRDILKQETVEKTVLEEIMADERKGVRQLVDAYIRRLNRESAERFRVEDMYEPESSFYKKGLEYVAGIDEVGRGPLAGPVTVAAVILKPHFFIAGLNDSKKGAPRRREEIAKKIAESAGLPIRYTAAAYGIVCKAENSLPVEIYVKKIWEQ